MWVVADPDNEFEAVKTTSKSPVCPDVGVQEKMAEVLVPFGVKVAPLGRPVALNEVMASESVAVTVKLRFVPTLAFSTAGAFTMGARLVPAALTVITKLSVLLAAPDVAVTPALKLPTSLAVGERVIVVETSPVPEVGPFSV